MVRPALSPSQQAVMEVRQPITGLMLRRKLKAHIHEGMLFPQAEKKPKPITLKEYAPTYLKQLSALVSDAGKAHVRRLDPHSARHTFTSRLSATAKTSNTSLSSWATAPSR